MIENIKIQNTYYEIYLKMYILFVKTKTKQFEPRCKLDIERKLIPKKLDEDEYTAQNTRTSWITIYINTEDVFLSNRLLLHHNSCNSSQLPDILIDKKPPRYW